MAAPTAKDIRRSVYGGLNMQNALTSSQVVGITFEPTVGIAAARIGKLGLDIRSFREPLKRAIKQVVIPSIQMNFEVGGRPDLWEPLSDFTLRRRQNDGISGGEPLVRSGKLKKTMSYYNIWTVTSTMAIIADLPPQIWYGKVHQAGYEGSGGGRRIKARGRKVRDVLEEIVDTAGSDTARVVPPIPPRPFVMLQPEDEDRITEIFIQWLGERVVAAWPGVRI